LLFCYVIVGMADSHLPPPIPDHITVHNDQTEIKSVMHTQLRNLLISRRTLYEWGNVLIQEDGNRRSLRIIPEEIYLKPNFVGKILT
jgi:hypothetical protein